MCIRDSLKAQLARARPEEPPQGGGDVAPTRLLYEGPRPEAAPQQSFDVKEFMNTIKHNFAKMV